MRKSVHHTASIISVTVAQSHIEHFIAGLEQACGREAIKDDQPLQPGDVAETVADITRSQADLGLTPKMTIEEGLPRIVAWFRDYHGL